MFFIPILVVAAASLAASLAQGIYSFYKIFDKMKNEEKFKEILKERLENDKEFGEKFRASLNDIKINQGSYLKLKEVIEDLLKDIQDKKIHESIEEGLKQPSESGQRNYTDKIIGNVVQTPVPPPIAGHS